MGIFRRLKFWYTADRIGPDIPLTHWMLHFKAMMRFLCTHRFDNFGEQSEFRPYAFAVACSNIRIGSRVVIRPGSFLITEPKDCGTGITIEDDVLMGNNVHIYTANHNFDRIDIPIIDQGHYQSRGVVLKKGCWIGANSVILPGVTIGQNCVVGAGSVVTKSFSNNCVVAGNPARMIRSIPSTTNKPEIKETAESAVISCAVLQAHSRA
ncbi:MAG: acyltransferase [Sedimentisphaerales bacterium]|nr:acyltransferase [Sedimentisphaerales bacterium]